MKNDQSLLVLDPELSSLIREHCDRALRALENMLSFPVVGILSSGSSGASKMIVHSYPGLRTSAEAVNQRLGVSRGDRWLQTLSPYHIAGFALRWRAEAAGGEFVDSSIWKKGAWDPLRFVDEVRTERINFVSLVPAQVFDLVQSGLKSPEGLKVCLVGAGHLRSDLFLAARNLGWPIQLSYAMTECASTVAVSSDGEWFEMLPHIEARLANQQNVSSSLPTGSAKCLNSQTDMENGASKVGEGVLEVRSLSLFVAQVDLTSGAVQIRERESWYLTSDRVGLDGNRLLPLGRVNEQVKVLGRLVDLAELRLRLARYISNLNLSIQPEMYELFAIDHPRRQSDLVLVVQEGSAQIDWNVILSGFNAQVESFERIQRVVLVEKIPRSAIGKVLQSDLVNLLKQSDMDAFQP